MAALSIGYVFIGWTGDPLALASASWKANVRGVYKVNNLRNSFISFKPAASFPAVTDLAKGGVYLFDVLTPFDLPSAVTLYVPGAADPAVLPTGEVELLPAAPYTSSATTTTPQAVGDADPGSFFVGTASPTTLGADLGVAATITAVQLTPRPAEVAGGVVSVQHEAELGGATLRGSTAPFTDPAGGAALATVPAGSWLSTDESTRLPATLTPARYLLLANATPYALAELRLIGPFVSGARFKPLAPTAVVTRAASGTASVALASATTNATIRYALDGTTPTLTTGLVYTAGQPIALPVRFAVTTIRAIAVQSGVASTDTTTVRVAASDIQATQPRYDTRGQRVAQHSGDLFYDAASGAIWHHELVLPDAVPGLQGQAPRYGVRCWKSDKDLSNFTRVPEGDLAHPFPPAAGARTTYERPHVLRCADGSGYALWVHAIAGLDEANAGLLVFKAAALGTPWTFQGVAASPAGTTGTRAFSFFADVAAKNYLLGAVNLTTAGADEVWLTEINAAGTAVVDGTSLVLDNRGRTGAADANNPAAQVGKREAPLLVYRAGKYVLLTSPAIGYAPSYWDYKVADSLTGLVGQKSAAGSLVANNYLAQPSACLLLPHVLDSQGEKINVLAGDAWNPASLSASGAVLHPLFFNLDGTPVVDRNFDNWTTAKIVGYNAATGARAYYAVGEGVDDATPGAWLFSPNTSVSTWNVGNGNLKVGPTTHYNGPGTDCTVALIKPFRADSLRLRTITSGATRYDVVVNNVLAYTSTGAETGDLIEVTGFDPTVDNFLVIRGVAAYGGFAVLDGVEFFAQGNQVSGYYQPGEAVDDATPGAWTYFDVSGRWAITASGQQVGTTRHLNGPGTDSVATLNRPFRATGLRLRTTTAPGIKYEVRVNGQALKVVDGTESGNFVELVGLNAAQDNILSIVGVAASGGTAVVDGVEFFTAPTTAAVFTEFAPTDANWQDTGPVALDNGYPRRSAQAQLSFSTPADRVEVSIYDGNFGRGYTTPPVGVLINGVYRELALTGAGPLWYPLLGLPPGTTNITLQAGAPNQTGLAATAVVATDILLVRATATVTFQTSPAPANRYVLLGDSITNGAAALPLARDSFALQMRKRFEAMNQGRVTLESISGDSMYRRYAQAGDRAAVLSQLQAELDGTSANTLLIALGTNDVAAGISPATFAAIYGAFLDDLHAARPLVRLVGMTPLYRNDTFAEPAAQPHRAALVDVARTRPWFWLLDGLSMMPASGLSGDNLHPSSVGHATLDTNLFPKLQNLLDYYPAGAGVDDSDTGAWHYLGVGWNVATSGPIKVGLTSHYSGPGTTCEAFLGKPFKAGNVRLTFATAANTVFDVYVDGVKAKSVTGAETSNEVIVSGLDPAVYHRLSLVSVPSANAFIVVDGVTFF